VKLSKRAIDFQLETAKANATLPDTGRLEFRADVNIGESSMMGMTSILT